MLCCPLGMLAQSVWFKRPVPLSSELQSVSYAGGNFTAVALGRSKVIQSRDGRSWAAYPLPDVVNQLTYHGGSGQEALYGVGGGGLMQSKSAGQFALSTELDSLIRSENESTGQPLALWSISSHAGKTCVLAYRVPQNGFPANVLFTLGNTGWSAETLSFSSAVADVRELYADFVVAGAQGVLLCSVAENPVAGARVWYRGGSGSAEEILPPEGAGGWGDLAAGAFGLSSGGGGNFVLVGKGGRVFRISEATRQASRVSVPTTASLRGVAYGLRDRVGGRWVAVGACGTILYSLSDTAQQWQVAQSRILDDLNAVTFGVNSFLAVGEGGIILQSN